MYASVVCISHASTCLNFLIPSLRACIRGCAGYMGYPPGTLRVNLFRYLVL